MLIHKTSGRYANLMLDVGVGFVSSFVVTSDISQQKKISLKKKDLVAGRKGPRVVARTLPVEPVDKPSKSATMPKRERGPAHATRLPSVLSPFPSVC